MVEEVLLFLEEIFEDKIEFYGKAPPGILIAGGYQEGGKEPRGFLE